MGLHSHCFLYIVSINNLHFTLLADLLACAQKDDIRSNLASVLFRMYLLNWIEYLF